MKRQFKKTQERKSKQNKERKARNKQWTEKKQHK